MIPRNHKLLLGTLAIDSWRLPELVEKLPKTPLLGIFLSTLVDVKWAIFLPTLAEVKSLTFFNSSKIDRHLHIQIWANVQWKTNPTCPAQLHGNSYISAFPQWPVSIDESNLLLICISLKKIPSHFIFNDRENVYRTDLISTLANCACVCKEKDRKSQHNLPPCKHLPWTRIVSC